MSDRYSRQSFLGPDAERLISLAKVAVAGLGGGGSHIVQQLAHVGVRDFVIADGDAVEESNLNRLVGALDSDVDARTKKVRVADRLIRQVTPSARVYAHPGRWQEIATRIATCDLVFGCVDGASQRDELERFARRYLLPYIDIGMDVVTVSPEPPRMTGQVFLSMPGRPCMWCTGLLRDGDLAREAARYGDAGPRPQVIWANGVLASLAVGIAVDLLTGWTAHEPTLCMVYDANTMSVRPAARAMLASPTCVHHPAGEVGPPRFASL